MALTKPSTLKTAPMNEKIAKIFIPMSSGIHTQHLLSSSQGHFVFYLNISFTFSVIFNLIIIITGLREYLTNDFN